MRIITGRARGIQLVTLEGDMTRPTSERAKMAIFSSLQFELEGRRVLDLFAGSGQMGLEAVSRGAEHAVLVDQSKDAVKVIQKNAEKTRLSEDCTVICSDFAEFLRQRRGKEPFDIVFIDPPYAMKACKAAVEALLENRLLKPHGIVVLESAEPDPLGVGTPLAERFEVVKSARYGVAHVSILTPKA
ncbi:MAG: 16S rRNA (guanine(966)-N(2))-methyltransferase RsmD [Clostridia bacterium]|nr:16S rRNA (guanine(966)-N(2))-methyltransferase RsmD [Clostridia bacterium]